MQGPRTTPKSKMVTPWKTQLAEGQLVSYLSNFARWSIVSIFVIFLAIRKIVLHASIFTCFCRQGIFQSVSLADLLRTWFQMLAHQFSPWICMRYFTRNVLLEKLLHPCGRYWKSPGFQVVVGVGRRRSLIALINHKQDGLFEAKKTMCMWSLGRGLLTWRGAEVKSVNSSCNLGKWQKVVLTGRYLRPLPWRQYQG